MKTPRRNIELIELLVVIEMIAILDGMLISALSRVDTAKFYADQRESVIERNNF